MFVDSVYMQSIRFPRTKPFLFSSIDLWHRPLDRFWCMITQTPCLTDLYVLLGVKITNPKFVPLTPNLGPILCISMGAAGDRSAKTGWPIFMIDGSDGTTPWVLHRNGNTKSQKCKLPLFATKIAPIRSNTFPIRKAYRKGLHWTPVTLSRL